MTWDPATTGGLTTTGIPGVPWLPLLIWVLFIGALATALHVHRGGTIGSPPTWWARLRPNLTFRTRSSFTGRFLGFLLWSVPFSVVMLTQQWDPLSSADPFAPGPNVAEIRQDGMWEDDSIENASSWSWTAGEPCLSE